MSDLHETVEVIRLKVSRLLEERKGLYAQISGLEAQNEDLKNQLETQKNTLSEIEEKNKIVKLAESLKNTGDIGELKQRLNEYIRDIDECIRLLSDR